MKAGRGSGSRAEDGGDSVGRAGAGIPHGGLAHGPADHYSTGMDVQTCGTRKRVETRIARRFFSALGVEALTRRPLIGPYLLRQPPARAPSRFILGPAESLWKDQARP